MAAGNIDAVIAQAKLDRKRLDSAAIGPVQPDRDRHRQRRRRRHLRDDRRGRRAVRRARR